MLIQRSAGQDRYVFLTEDPVLAREVVRTGEAVIGVIYPGSEWEDWSGISYMIQLNHIKEAEDVEDWYVQEVWCRCHKEPIIIGVIKDPESRYLLREMRLADVEALYTLYEDPVIKRWITPLDSDIFVEKEKTAAYIRNVYGLYGCGMWVLEEEKTGWIVGRVGVEPTKRNGEMQFFLGYMIAASRRRRHLAERACDMALDYVRMRQEPEAVWCRIAEDNAASQKLAEKLGFVLRENKEGEMLWKKEYL